MVPRKDPLGAEALAPAVPPAPEPEPITDADRAVLHRVKASHAIEFIPEPDDPPAAAPQEEERPSRPKVRLFTDVPFVGGAGSEHEQVGIGWNGDAIVLDQRRERYVLAHGTYEYLPVVPSVPGRVVFERQDGSKVEVAGGYREPPVTRPDDCAHDVCMDTGLPGCRLAELDARVRAAEAEAVSKWDDPEYAERQNEAARQRLDAWDAAHRFGARTRPAAAPVTPDQPDEWIEVQSINCGGWPIGSVRPVLGRTQGFVNIEAKDGRRVSLWDDDWRPAAAPVTQQEPPPQPDRLTVELPSTTVDWWADHDPRPVMQARVIDTIEACIKARALAAAASSSASQPDRAWSSTGPAFPASASQPAPSREAEHMQREIDGLRRVGAEVITKVMDAYATDPSNGHIHLWLRDLLAIFTAKPAAAGASQPAHTEPLTIEQLDAVYVAASIAAEEDQDATTVDVRRAALRAVAALAGVEVEP